MKEEIKTLIGAIFIYANIGIICVLVVLVGLGIFVPGALTDLGRAVGIKPAATIATPARTKPLCSSVQVPVGDCVHQWELDLPPDPGEAGKATIAGIITNNKGVRDDVYRFIWYAHPDSERAREALFLMARVKQMTVVYGDSLGKEETRKLAPELTKSALCLNRIDENGTSIDGEAVRVEVTNTFERLKRSREFEYFLAHNLYEHTPLSAAEACGFDPNTLSN